YAVSVFHAYAHEAFCQCIYHSRKREGFGLTDGQTLIKQYQHALELKEISQKDLEKLELQNYFLDIIKSS
ncbi:4377_t:CDS:2, partial [Rhizophagus irregularis]